jgi:hypothetical protein
MDTSSLKFAGSDWIRSCAPMFFWSFVIRGSVVKLCCLLTSCDTSYGSWWSQRRRMTWKPSFWGLATVVLVFVAMRNLLGDLWLVVVALECGGGSIGAVQRPTLQGKNPKSGLNWLCLTIALLKALFCKQWLSLGWKPMIYDRAMRMLVHCFLFCRRCYWRSWTSGVVLVVVVRLLQGINHCSGTFSFLYFFFYFLAMCIHNVIRALHCCRGYSFGTHHFIHLVEMKWNDMTWWYHFILPNPQKWQGSQ